MPTITIDHWLSAATDQLAASGITSARLDCLLLLDDCLQRERAWLLAHPETTLSPTQQARLQTWLDRRAAHEPLAYIRGFVEFYGRTFDVTPDVLVPRPESEAIIDLLLKLAPGAQRIADIGTGSGCLAITAALETGAVVCAVDVDEACLAVTERNAVLHAASPQLLQGSLLEPLGDFAPEVVLANLPYVPTDYAINEAARHEPALALFAGSDGLDLYRLFFEQLSGARLVLTESLPAQHPAMVDLALAAGYRLTETVNFVQAFLLT